MIIGYAIPAVQKFQGAAYKSLYYQALEISKADGATPDENPCLLERGDELYRAGEGAVPSVLIVPQFVKPGAVYTQIPTPTLEGGDFDQFTVTRATTATRVNASGLIESVASGVLRLDYPVTGGCPAALIEPSAQNLVLQSRDLSVSGNWTASGITAVKNAVGADGTASGATTLTATAASGTITQALSHASQSRIFSAVIRRVSGSGAVELTTNGGTNWDAVTLTTDYSQLACTARTVASGTVGIRMIASGDVIEVDYTQGEVGPVATSPIPTTTGSATRNADVCSVSGVSGYIGQTEGCLLYTSTSPRD